AEYVALLALVLMLLQGVMATLGGSLEVLAARAQAGAPGAPAHGRSPGAPAHGRGHAGPGRGHRSPAAPARGRGGAPAGPARDQLERGFRDAGRPDLARIAHTRDFQTWIRQESGWNPKAVSPANNQGLRNDGLFQVWRGHAFNRNGEVSRMSPY